MTAAETETPVVAERIEMAKLAGRLLGAVEYLEKRLAVHRLEEGGIPTGLARIVADARSSRERLVELSRVLPEGPLEAFGREHPLFDDPIDGPYCGYGAKDGRPYTCQVRDPALHWDAWEMLGTRHKRPERAVRKPS